MAAKDSFNGLCIVRRVTWKKLESIFLDKNLKHIVTTKDSSLKFLANVLYEYKQKDPAKFGGNFRFVSTEAEALKKEAEGQIKNWNLFFREEVHNISLVDAERIFIEGKYDLPCLREIVKKEEQAAVEENVAYATEEENIVYVGEKSSPNRPICGLLLLDTETGGLDENETSLLTFYGKILDTNFKSIDSLSVKMKENDGRVLVNRAAIKKNKLNLETHVKEAVTYDKARAVIGNWLIKHTQNRRSVLIPVAHNLEFDKRFLTAKGVIPSWETIFGRDSICTKQLVTFLRLIGLIQMEDLSTSLEKVAAHFNINTDNAHDAKIDVEMMEQILLIACKLALEGKK
jgi:hypothetical protein